MYYIFNSDSGKVADRQVMSVMLCKTFTARHMHSVSAGLLYSRTPLAEVVLIKHTREDKARLG